MHASWVHSSMNGTHEFINNRSKSDSMMTYIYAHNPNSLVIETMEMIDLP